MSRRAHEIFRETSQETKLYMQPGLACPQMKFPSGGDFPDGKGWLTQTQ